MFHLRKVLFGSFFLISSLCNAMGYVDKDHYLYPIMIDIRYKKYDEAMAKLEPYALEGDATALFWYGYMKQSNWGRDRFDAYQWYEKSMERNNPYSMFKLSGEESTEYVCEVNQWDCSEENFDKAIARWKELAEKGDPKAEFFYRVYDRSVVRKLFDKALGYNEDYIIDAANKGYYRILARSIKWAGMEDYRDVWGEDMYQLLLTNIDKDPKIAMYFVYNPYEGMTQEDRRRIYLDSLSKGYIGKGYIGKRYSWAIREGLISNEEAYVFSRSEHLGFGLDFNQNENVEWFKINPNDVGELNKKSEDFFNNMDHVINFDEMDFMYFGKEDV